MVDVKRVQDRLLKMAVLIRDVLDKHNIPYCLAYGTLLGAIRHKNLIPWDDDFDFWLFDDSYDDALKYLSQELPNDLFLEYFNTEPKYFHSWAHVKDLNSVTECKEYPQDSFYTHKGISIDLYKLTRLQIKNLWSFLNNENKEYIQRRKEKGLIADIDYKTRLETIVRSEQTQRVLEGDKDREVLALVSPYKCKYLEIHDVFPLKYCKIGNCLFLGPNNFDNVLTNIYGDYMKLPPIEKRVSHYSNVLFLEEE